LRKLIVLCVLVLASVAAMPSAEAAPASYRFNGSSAFVIGGGCGFAFQTYDAKVRPPSGNRTIGSFHLEGCVTSPSGAFEFDGTARVTLNGTTKTGTANGPVTSSSDACPAAYPYPSSLDFTIVLTSGPTMHLTGVWCSDGASGGPIRGQLARV
jgi:hypothetical protein